MGQGARVRVVRLGKSVQDLDLDAGTTLDGVLALVGVDPGQSAVDVRINGQSRPGTWEPVNGDIVTIVPPSTSRKLRQRDPRRCAAHG